MTDDKLIRRGVGSRRFLAGCDDDACFSGANGGRPRDQLTYPLLDNLRGVPVVSFHGTEDELVPVTGAIRQADRLRELGYRYRLYLFPGEEHYGPPVVDQWAEGAAYEHRFVRDPNPPQVTEGHVVASDTA